MYHTSGISRLASRISDNGAVAAPAIPQLDPSIHTFSAYLSSHNEKQLNRRVRTLTSRLKQKDLIIDSLKAQLAQHQLQQRVNDSDEQEDEQEEEDEEEEEQEDRQDEIEQEEGGAVDIKAQLITELKQRPAQRHPLCDLTNTLSAPSTPPTRKPPAPSISDLIHAVEIAASSAGLAIDGCSGCNCNGPHHTDDMSGEEQLQTDDQPEGETQPIPLDDICTTAISNQRLASPDLIGWQVEGETARGDSAEGLPCDLHAALSALAESEMIAAPSRPPSAAVSHKRQRSETAVGSDDHTDRDSCTPWKRLKDSDPCMPPSAMLKAPFAFPAALAALPPSSAASLAQLTPYRSLAVRTVDRRSIAQIAASPMRFAIPQL